MSDSIFERVEIKYKLNQAQYQAVRKAMEGHMQRDLYGRTTIMSMYYDTEDALLIRRSIQSPQPAYKEKFRIRSYSVPSDWDTVYLEIKKKYDGVVYKRRTAMTLSDANRFMKGEWSPAYQDQTTKEIDYFRKKYDLKPFCIVAYEREAFVSTEAYDVRMTFDDHIRARFTDLDMKHGAAGEELPGEPFYIMELKADAALPLWLTDTLTENQIFHARFSKIGSFYMEKMKKERIQHV